ncbi:hypothetical protein FRC02_011503 [Tulasnella sp. 418]|nr:hypothetical protein FRC02_011503 [Tulasnella sp. 418]
MHLVKVVRGRINTRDEHPQELSNATRSSNVPVQTSTQQDTPPLQPATACVYQPLIDGFGQDELEEDIKDDVDDYVPHDHGNGNGNDQQDNKMGGGDVKDNDEEDNDNDDNDDSNGGDRGVVKFTPPNN